MMAIKGDENQKSEKDRENIILRCYECYGKTAKLSLKGDLNLKIIGEVNCLEEDNNQKFNTKIKPWKVKTFKLYFQH